MKLLCFGDLHLGAGGQYPGRLDDQRDVLGRIAGLAVERGVDGILFAGDAFEGPASKILPEHLDAFASFIAACRTVDIPILAINGNGMHDAAVRDKNGLAIFNHVDGITVSSYPDIYAFAGCTIATLPWVHPGRLIARAGHEVSRDEVNAICADLLVDIARRGIADCEHLDAGAAAILLGHGLVSGTSLPTGLAVDTLSGPVMPVEDLESIGYDALVYGDVHAAQPIGPTGFYTGSPLPLNHGEAHVGHGIWILTTNGRHGDVTHEFVAIDSPRFVTIDVDFTDGQDFSQLLEGYGGYDPEARTFDDAIVRVRFTCTADEARRQDLSRVRGNLIAAGARVVKIEPQIIREQRARVAGVDEQLDELAAVDLWLTANAIDGDTADVMRSKTREYLEATA